MTILSEAEKLARREAQQRAERERQDKQDRQQAVLEGHYRQSYRRYRDWQATKDRLCSLVPKALDVLERALSEEADPKQALSAALSVLRAAGLNGLAQPQMPDRIHVHYEVDPELEDVPA